VTRGFRREFISRCYNWLLRRVLHVRFSDAQCWFKAIRADAAHSLVEDDAWFFDTELLVLAERSGMRIDEVPVDWVENTDDSVKMVRTAVGDLRGIARPLRSAVRVRPVDTVRQGAARTPTGSALALATYHSPVFGAGVPH